MVTCPVDGSKTNQKFRNTPYWVCLECSLWFQNPQPPKTYEADHELNEAGESTGHLVSEGDRNANKSLANSLYKNWLKGPSKTLDVGAKYPLLAHYLKANGCDSFAMDNISIVPEYSKELGVPMLQADFEQISEKQVQEWTETEAFDLITMVHVFEHMYDPQGALRKLKSLLKPNGLLFIRMPDHDVQGYERDLTPGHFTIHPNFWTLKAFLELLYQVQDCFTLVETYAMVPGQRDYLLRPIKKAPRIGIGMIAKNEERDLPRCLKSLEGVAHGFVMADTGSTDSTIQVAKDWAKRNFSGSHINIETYTGASEQDATGDWKLWDFAKARNQYVNLLETLGFDWILWMDADDELKSREIRNLAYWTQYDIHGIQIQAGDLRWPHHRMWQTKKGITYKGRVHEYPQWSGPAVIHSDLTIQHDGAAPLAGEHSNPRNLRILEREMEEAPTSRAAFYYANTLKDSNQFEKAVPAYQKYLDYGIGYRDEYLFGLLYKGRCERAAGKIDDAITTLKKGVELQPDWSEFTMELAYIAVAQQDYPAAVKWCEASIHPAPPTQLFREANKYTDQPWRQLSFIHEQTGSLVSSLKYAEKALEAIGAPDAEWSARIAALRVQLPKT